MMRHARSAALAIALDRVFGEPPITPHPIAAFGSWMKRVESALYSDDRARGVVHLGVGVATGALAGAALHSTTLAATLSIAGNALDAAASEVESALLAGDLDRAREYLPALVGRDPSRLDEREIARAVIESLAENTVDAAVAPALWAAVGGAKATLAYRAINTLDAMVGHRNERYGRFGWASARTDDVANYFPARIAALCVMAARPSSAVDIATAVRRDAPAHPSPNGGVIETAFAVALGIRLGGPSDYGGTVEMRPALGTGRPAEPTDIAAARRLAFEVGAVLSVGLLATAFATDFATQRTRSRR